MFCRFMEPAVIAILGGVLPFGSIFIEMYVRVSDMFSALYLLYSTIIGTGLIVEYMLTVLFDIFPICGYM